MSLVVVDPVAVEVCEGVEDLAPGGDPGGDVVTGPLFLDHDEIEDFHGRLFGGEVPASASGLTESAVQRLDHVRGVNQLTNLDVECEEGCELFPRRLPEPDHRGVFGLPPVGELVEAQLRGLDRRCRVDGPQTRGDVLPVPAVGVAQTVAHQMHLIPISE